MDGALPFRTTEVLTCVQLLSEAGAVAVEKEMEMLSSGGSSPPSVPFIKCHYRNDGEIMTYGPDLQRLLEDETNHSVNQGSESLTMTSMASR